MSNSKSLRFVRHRQAPKRRMAIALMSATLLWGGYMPQVWSAPEPMLLSQRQGSWDAVLNTARMVNDAGEITALVLQLDVLDKPVTTYANAIYQVYARLNGRWTEIYTNTGARLIASPEGRLSLPPEVVLLSDLDDQLDGADLSDVELRSVVTVRYDADGNRNQDVSWEQVQDYSAIAQVTRTQVESGRSLTAQSTTTTTTSTTTVTSSSSSSSNTDYVSVNPGGGGEPNNTQNIHRGHFSLGIFQSRVTYSDVIARVSLMPRRSNGFLEERFIGDFRYRMNQRAQFVRGVNPGDRVIVRLFDLQNNFIGYSEFELLDDFAAVNLVLPSADDGFGLVRTVYGIDSDRNGSIDSGSTVYDYFTRISNYSSYSESRVTFLPSTQGIDTSLFALSGLPSIPSTCRYTNSFLTGSFSLVSRTISIVRSALAPALVSLPGSLTQIVNISSTTIYEVSSLIVNYQEIGISEGSIIVIDDNGEYEYGDDDDYDYEDDDRDYDHDYEDDDDRGGRRHCNQGIGNGAEGCDPGNSHPHGGSNDEGGRTPGNGRGGHSR